MQPSKEYSRVGDWLYRNRRAANPPLGQEAVANVAGVSLNTYRRWEAGKAAPDVIQLQRIQTKFGWTYLPNC